MKNIGPKSNEWLASVGIHTLDDVASLGVIETYKRVKAAKSLNLLYAVKRRSPTCRGMNFHPTSKLK